MEWNDGADTRNGLKVAAILLVGFLFLLVSITRVYFTAESVVRRAYFCTPWTDIPGRLAILVISYYVAGVCGVLPIPDCLLLNRLSEPLLLWKFQTWRDTFRKFLSSCYLIKKPHMNGQNISELPHGQEQRDEIFYDCLLIRNETSESSQIINSERTVSVTNRAIDECSITSVSSDDSFMSLDSPIFDYIDPVVKRNSSGHSYLINTDVLNSESTNEQTEAIDEQGRNLDSPSRATNIRTVRLPKYPRYPWSFLRDSDGIPEIAKEIHKRNLKIEKREIEEYVRKQKTLVEVVDKTESPSGSQPKRVDGFRIRRRRRCFNMEVNLDEPLPFDRPTGVSSNTAYRRIRPRSKPLKISKPTENSDTQN